MRRFLVLAMAAALMGCPARTTVQRAGDDADISRDIRVQLREDARFADVWPVCVDRVVRLEGRVDNPKAAEDALRIARSWARGAEIVSKLEVRPR